jgi:hypothetical protein
MPREMPQEKPKRVHEATIRIGSYGPGGMLVILDTANFGSRWVTPREYMEMLKNKGLGARRKETAS